MKLLTMALAIGLLATTASAAFDKGDFELSLAATGATPAQGDSFQTGGTVGLGYFLSKDIEIGVRQGFSYSDTGPATWGGSTQGALDVHFPLGDDANILPFVGFFGGASYATHAETSWRLGPEAGIKFFLDDNTILALMAQYGFDPDSDFDSGSFGYSLGLSFRF